MPTSTAKPPRDERDHVRPGEALSPSEAPAPVAVRRRRSVWRLLASIPVAAVALGSFWGTIELLASAGPRWGPVEYSIVLLVGAVGIAAGWGTLALWRRPRDPQRTEELGERPQPGARGARPPAKLVGEVQRFQSRNEGPSQYGQSIVWTFHLARFDPLGNALAPIPVEMVARTFKGFLNDGDTVELFDDWQPGTPVRPERVYNRTKDIEVVGDRPKTVDMDTVKKVGCLMGMPFLMVVLVVLGLVVAGILHAVGVLR